MARNAAEFLFGEEIARLGTKGCLRALWRRVSEEIQELRQLKRDNPAQYYQRLYRILTNTGSPQTATSPLKKIWWYAIRNFPQVGFVVDEYLYNWWGYKLRASSRRRFKRFSRRYRRRGFKRFSRRYRRRGFKRYYRRQRRSFRRSRYYRRY